MFCQVHQILVKLFGFNYCLNIGKTFNLNCIQIHLCKNRQIKGKNWNKKTVILISKMNFNDIIKLKKSVILNFK